jgi:hypothetical protein
MHAYSRLKSLLTQRRMSVPELHRRIRSQGLHVDVKSLYRLSDDRRPVDRLDMRVAGAICQVVAVPLSDWIVFEADGQRFRTLDPGKQARLDVLMTGNNAGRLSERECHELQTLVREAEELTLANARLLAGQQQRLQPASATAGSAS